MTRNMEQSVSYRSDSQTAQNLENSAGRAVQKLPMLTASKLAGLQRFRARLRSYSLPNSIVDDLLDRQIVLSIAKNALVFTKGSSGDVVYCIRAGLVDLLWRDSKGRELLVDVATPGDLLGFMDFPGIACSQIFDARARTRCEVGILTRERITSALEHLTPKALVSLAEQINGAWSERIALALTFGGLAARERLGLVLSRLAEKCGIKEQEGTMIVPELRHKDLGLMIGASRPMVSRLLAQMLAQGDVLQRGRRFVVCNGTTMHANVPTA